MVTDGNVAKVVCVTLSDGYSVCLIAIFTAPVVRMHRFCLMCVCVCPGAKN